MVVPAVFVVASLLAASPAHANPADGTVVAGEARIVEASPTRLIVIQDSNSAIIDWRRFGIGLDEHTDFQQPSAQSITLNRVTGDTRSDLLGRLTANGIVMLINPNGILIGESAIIDVNGLVATTIDIDNADFMAGRYNFDASTNPSGVFLA